MHAAYVTRLFVYRSDTSLGGVYTVMSLFYYLPAVWPRMRKRTVLRTYEGGDKVNDACFLLVLLLPGHLRCNQYCVCVAGSVLPSPTTGSCMQEGFFMSNELSVWICDIYTTGIFGFLPCGWLTRSEAFV